MRQKKLVTLYKQAIDYMETHYIEDLEWARSITSDTFKNIKSKKFLEVYCWVVYASGFKVSILEEKFPSLKLKFRGFDIESLSRMRSVKTVLETFDHSGKAEGFLEGAKKIYKEGFSNYKRRLNRDGIDVLCELPYIGNITKKMLAKNIGYLDVPKDDRWLERIKDYVNADNVEEMTIYLSNKFTETEHVIDVVLWRYCADMGKKIFL